MRAVVVAREQVPYGILHGFCEVLELEPCILSGVCRLWDWNLAPRMVFTMFGSWKLAFDWNCMAFTTFWSWKPASCLEFAHFGFRLMMIGRGG